MKASILFIFLCLSISFSCKKKVNSNMSSLNRDVAYISQDSLVEGTLGLVDSVAYIKLETTDDCLLGRVEKLEIHDGKIFVQDANQNLYAFAEDGKFIAKIGNKGRGAEEYATIGSFCLDKANNWVGIIDQVGQKMVYYDFQGKFVKDIPSRADHLNFILSSVQYKDVLLNFYASFFQVIYSVQMCDVENMELKESLHPYLMNRTAYSIWTNRPYAETSDGISFIKPFSDTIFQYDGNMVKPRFILGHNQPLANQGVCDAFNRKMSKDETFYSFLSYLSTNGYFQSILKIYETKDHLLLAVKTDEYTVSHIVWNKKLNKGNYEGMMIRYDKKYIYRPFIQNMISSTDDCFVVLYNDDDINDFAKTTQIGYRIDPQVQEIVNNWSEGDNPVVALFYMKKGI